jgi:hypothetical protein
MSTNMKLTRQLPKYIQHPKFYLNLSCVVGQTAETFIKQTHITRCKAHDKWHVTDYTNRKEKVPEGLNIIYV